MSPNEAVAEMDARNDDLSVSVAQELVEFSRNLTTERHSEVLLQKALESARRLTFAEGGAVLTLDRTARHLHTVVATREGTGLTSALRATVPIYDENNAFNLSEPSAHAVMTGKIVQIEDIYKYSGFKVDYFQEQDRQTGLRTVSLAIVPMRTWDDFTVGVLQLVNMRNGPGGEVGPLPEAMKEPLIAFAAQAASALANARLLEENRRLARQLDRVNAALKRENQQLRSQTQAPPPARSGLIGDSPQIRRALNLVERAARTKVAVLVLGETGTGKEMIASAIHKSSDRADKPWVAQNCAALPEALLESELFGYKKGAFTGAAADTDGLVHAANGGTMFLDEVGDMPLGVQAKLLRLLQEGEVRRVGATETEKVDVRIVAATHVNLRDKIAAGTFREDLFYRLSVFPIELPPLRERPSDIPLLIDFFLSVVAKSYNQKVAALTPDALHALLRWRYPGNVRELKNIIERAVLLIDEGERIDLGHLPPEIAAGGSPGFSSTPLPTIGETGDLKSIMRRYEAMVVEAKLREAGWNQSETAKKLRISRRALIDKIQLYGIRKPTESRSLSEPS